MRFFSIATRLILFGLILSIFLAIGKVHATYFGDYDLTSSPRFGWIVTYSIICYVVAYSFGLPDQRLWPTRIKASLVSALASALVIASLQILVGEITIPRFVLTLSVPSLFLLFTISSLLITSLNQTAAQSERLLLICSDADKTIIESDLAFHSEVPCFVAKHLTVETARDTTNFPQTILDHGITLIVLGNDALKDPDIISSVTSAHSSGVRIRTQIAFYNDWVGKIPVRELGEAALLFDVREVHHVGYSRVSRLLDIGVASIGFLVLIIATPIVLIGNFLGNKGPLLYSQDRVGKGQTAFRILKFRSMSPGGLVSEWTKADDSRITRFGKFLRLSHLDELPQVINILRGDLSIVGPRPEQLHYVDQLSSTIPYYQSRHLVRPGLTGWAQVNYPYGADEIDAFEKLQYEFWYLQHQSMLLDLRIIARTFRHVLGFKGR